MNTYWPTRLRSYSSSEWMVRISALPFCQRTIYQPIVMLPSSFKGLRTTHTFWEVFYTIGLLFLPVVFLLEVKKPDVLNQLVSFCKGNAFHNNVLEFRNSIHFSWVGISWTQSFSRIVKIFRKKKKRGLWVRGFENLFKRPL